MKTVIKVVLSLLIAGTSFSSSEAREVDPYKYNPGALAEPAPVKYDPTEEEDAEDEDDFSHLEGSGRNLRPRRSRSKPRYSGSRKSRGARKITNYRGAKARVTRRGSRRSSVRVNARSRRSRPRGRRTVIKVRGGRSNYYRGGSRSTVIIRGRTPVSAVCSSNY